MIVRYHHANASCSRSSLAFSLKFEAENSLQNMQNLNLWIWNHFQYFPENNKKTLLSQFNIYDA